MFQIQLTSTTVVDAVKRILLLLLLTGIMLVSSTNVLAQSKWKQFKRLSGPEKRWLLIRPFCAKHVKAASNYALVVTDSIKATGQLGTDGDGGQLDAFRHAMWMTAMKELMGKQKALRFGKKHEKGNYCQFKRGKKEDGALPDRWSTEMDLENNRIACAQDYGLKSTWSDQIVSDVRQGKYVIIKKDDQGNSLNEAGEIVPASENWDTKRTLVPSNQ